MHLFAGQKLRFKGRNALTRARELAEELQGACKRDGAALEITRDVEANFKPGSNGFHLTPIAEHKVERAPAFNAFKFRSSDFR